MLWGSSWLHTNSTVQSQPCDSHVTCGVTATLTLGLCVVCNGLVDVRCWKGAQALRKGRGRKSRGQGEGEGERAGDKGIEGEGERAGDKGRESESRGQGEGEGSRGQGEGVGKGE